MGTIIHKINSSFSIKLVVLLLMKRIMITLICYKLRFDRIEVTRLVKQISPLEVGVSVKVRSDPARFPANDCSIQVRIGRRSFGQ